MAKPKVYNRYTIRSAAPNQYLCSKLSPDYEVLGAYTLTESDRGTLHCDCPAYKPWCRHCDMLRKFQAEEKVGSGWFYIPETKEWVEPIATGE